MLKRGLASVLAAAMAFSAAVVAGAQPIASDTAAVTAEAQSSEYTEYAQYLEANKQLVGKGEEISIDAVNYSSFEGAALNAGEGLEWSNEEGSVTWSFEVKVSGAYNLEIEYKPLGELSDPIEIAVLLDGTYPFEEAQSVFLPRNFENGGEIRRDDEGNEFAPEAIQISDWFTVSAQDPAGFNTEPLCFAMQAGMHTVSLEALSQQFAIKSIRLVPIEELPDYKEYLSSNKGKNYSGKTVTVEGEDAKVRSKKAIVPLSDNSGASVYPQDAFISRINYIGGTNWSRPGDTITWEVEVPESGYYALNFSYRQNHTLNETFYRTLKIDGEIPFEEAKEMEFEYSGSWSSTVFEDENGEPYKIYLEKGSHTLSLTVTMGPIAAVCGELDDLVYELAAFYRSMVMITGENPDANRDYNLFTQIEDYDGRLKSYSESLSELLDELYKITGDDSGTAPTNLRNMKDVVDRMRTNKYYAHQYKQRFYDNYAALSAWVYERSSMPLDIDGIFLNSPEAPNEGRNAGFFSQMVFSAKRFAASFVSQYKTAEQTEGKSITLWINWGRDQAKVLKSLVSSDFTADKGIKVNIRVTNATLLQGILSGNGPDCSIQVSRSEPVNLAMRGGLYDLSQFDDYEEIMERFMPGAGVPYEYEGGNYAIPNTQSFYMLFYRTDIFEQMGLTVPDTWDEFLNTSNQLLRKNMQVGLPYVQITDMSQVNAGVGALNIFPTLLMQKGISLYNSDKTASTLMEPETIETFVQWTDYYTKYGLPKTYDFYNRFRVGLMPMAVVSYTMYASLTAAAPEISRFWKMAPIPGVMQEDGTVDRSVSGGGTAAIILKSSKNPELAWEFIKWWTSADTQYSYASEVENILGTAARHDTANVEALKKLSWDKENLEALLSQWENVNEIPEIPGGYYLSRVIDQVFWNTTNGEDPYEMMAKWGRIANNEIERKGEQYGKQ